MIKFKYKASKATIDLGTAFQQKPGLNLSMFLAENKPSCWLLIIMKSLDLPFLSSSVIPLITGWSSHLPSRRWSLGLPLFYPLLHSLISHQSPISAHKKTQADSGDLGWPLYRSVPVPRGASGAHDEPKVTIRGGKRGYDGKRDFFKKGWTLPPSNMNTQLSPDYLRITNWGVSVLQRGVRQREALFPSLLSTKCVCGEVSWWQLNAPNLYTSASLCFTYLLKRLIHAFIPVAEWFTAPSHTHTHMLHKHIWTPDRSWEVLTQSPFLLCWKAGKTVVRHAGFSCHVERLSQYIPGWSRTRAQLLNRKSPGPPAVLLAAWPAVSRGRKSKNWHWYNSFKKAPSVLGLCVNLIERRGWRAVGDI